MDCVNANFTLEELQNKETLGSSHFDNLKIDEDCYRVWLSRMTIDDGMEYNNQVTVEELVNGVWVIARQYQAF